MGINNGRLAMIGLFGFLAETQLQGSASRPTRATSWRLSTPTSTSLASRLSPACSAAGGLRSSGRLLNVAHGGWLFWADELCLWSGLAWRLTRVPARCAYVVRFSLSEPVEQEC